MDPPLIDEVATLITIDADELGERNQCALSFRVIVSLVQGRAWAQRFGTCVPIIVAESADALREYAARGAGPSVVRGAGGAVVGEIYERGAVECVRCHLPKPDGIRLSRICTDRMPCVYTTQIGSPDE